MFLSFITFHGNKCENLLNAWYVRTLPSFCLKTLVILISLFLLEELGYDNLMSFKLVVQWSLQLKTILSVYHSNIFTIDI